MLPEVGERHRAAADEPRRVQVLALVGVERLVERGPGPDEHGGREEQDSPAPPSTHRLLTDIGPGLGESSTNRARSGCSREKWKGASYRLHRQVGGQPEAERGLEPARDLGRHGLAPLLLPDDQALAAAGPVRGHVVGVGQAQHAGAREREAQVAGGRSLAPGDGAPGEAGGSDPRGQHVVRGVQVGRAPQRVAAPDVHDERRGPEGRREDQDPGVPPEPAAVDRPAVDAREEVEREEEERRHHPAELQVRDPGDQRAGEDQRHLGQEEARQQPLGRRRRGGGARGAPGRRKQHQEDRASPGSGSRRSPAPGSRRPRRRRGDTARARPDRPPRHRSATARTRGRRTRPRTAAPRAPPPRRPAPRAGEGGGPGTPGRSARPAGGRRRRAHS